MITQQDVKYLGAECMLRRSSLRSQLLLAVALACCAILSTQVMIRYMWTLPQFSHLALYNDKLEIKRFKSVLQLQLKRLQNIAYDNAVWDGSYTKALARDQQWFKDNFMIGPSFQHLSINGLYFYDNEQQLLAGMSVDNNLQPITVTMFSAPQDIPTKLLISTEEVQQNQLMPVSKTSFIKVNDKPAVVISQSIAPSLEQGVSAGTLLLWHYLDGRFIGELMPLANDDIRIIDPAQESDIGQHISTMLQADDIQIKLWKNSLYLGVLGLDNQLLLVFAIPQSPRIYDEALFNPALSAGIAVSFLTLLLFYLYISRKLVEPVRHLLKTISYVNFSNDYSARANLRGHNEIHKLGRLIDLMFELVAQQQQKLTMKNRQLQDLSNTDALTGLANRRYLDEYLATLRNSVINRKQPIAMLVVDVDFFKRYNDFYGHAMGDKVLQQVAIALQESTHRATDLICRYGGEEFVLVLENTSKEEAMVVAGNLCQAVEKLGIAHQTSAASKVVTISVGLAVKPADAIIEYETLFAWADAALYIAKDNGRNRYEVA